MLYISKSYKTNKTINNTIVLRYEFEADFY